MRTTLLAALSLLSLCACSRKPRPTHAVSVVDTGAVVMVSGVFGLTGPSTSALSASQSYSGVRRGRCLRMPSARQVMGDPETMRAVAAARAPGSFRDAGELIVRDDRGPELAVIRPMFHGLYMGVIQRRDVRRIRVRVTGGDGIAAHEFDSIPLNPAGNPVRITSPSADYAGRRGAPLRIAWAGAGYRDAFLTLSLMPSSANDVRAIVCRLDYGRGSITLSGADLDLPGTTGPIVFNAQLTTMTSSVEGPWVLNAMTSGAMLTGTLR